MSVIIDKRFRFWIPTADLMAKMDSSIQEIFNGNVHNTVCSKPATNDVTGEIIFFWIMLRLEFWEQGQDLNLRPSGYEPDELPDCSTLLQKNPKYSFYEPVQRKTFFSPGPISPSRLIESMVELHEVRNFCDQRLQLSKIPD